MNRKKALISVSDKNGIVELAKALQLANWEILSTGGTAKYLRENNITITDVASVTGFPEILDGRVKTLHPKIHGALLAIPDDKKHQEQIIEHEIRLINLLVVNLYPFVQTISKSNISIEEAIENIDIGGPAMIRAASKNNKYLTVVVSPDYYPQLISYINNGQIPDESERRQLAARAFAHTSNYDLAITKYLAKLDKTNKNINEIDTKLPAEINLNLQQCQSMRYGENAHQSAALYSLNHQIEGFSNAKIIQGKAMSFNNFADANAALGCLLEFSKPACVIIKHANPCGVAVADNIHKAYNLAFACDPVSAFGGILAFNRIVSADTANAIGEQFAEVIIAPEYSVEALAIFAKKTNLRILQMPIVKTQTLDIRFISGGYLIQTPDEIVTEKELKVVSKAKPTDKDLAELVFAFTVAKHVKSNAIIFAKDGQTLGIGAGQMSRVDSTRIAVFKAGDRGFNLNGAYAASDAFFPFRDGLDELAKAGAKAVIHPGGSMRDSEVINAADEHGLIMVFSGVRHFRH